MCGYAGSVFASQKTFQNTMGEQDLKNRFVRAAKDVAHRGNDDARTAFHPLLWLQHFRLAFQDVAAGVQPWYSPDGTHVIVFNGEIYNHLDLRSEITKKIGFTFKTRSDTETILACYLAYGEQCIEKLEGEFSFVIARTDGTEVFASRDYYGVKPLFFFLSDVPTAQFAVAKKQYEISTPHIEFASEIKGLASQKRWNRDGALRQFVGLFEPIRTPFENIIQMPPGGIFSAKRVGEVFLVTLKTNAKAIREPAQGSSRLHPRDSQEALADVLAESVKNRLLSDVELGVYLSGGIDSKAVAYELYLHYKESELSKHFKKPKSFTIGFKEHAFDETKEAMDYARHLGLDPYSVTVDNEALAYSYPHAVYISENLQPYTNGAAKWWLSLFTRQHVHGVLTGDGADEVWGGYPSFRYAAWWKFAMRNRPGKTFADKLKNSPLGSRWRDAVYLKKFSGDSKNPWLAGSSAAGNGFDFVESLALWGVPHPLFGQILSISAALLGAQEARAWLLSQRESILSWYAHGFDFDETFLSDPENALLLWQNYFCKTHLPVQILNWVGDRMEMANTLEGRTPFLSREMRSLLYKLPDSALVAGLQDKALLRRCYAKRIPHRFAYTPKRQFGAPFLNTNKLSLDYDAAAVFEKSGITDNTRFSALLKSINTEQNVYERTHLESTLQTALSLSIVQRTLVEGEIPVRDRAYEARVLTQQ